MYFKSGDTVGGNVHVSADARDGKHFLIFARVDLEKQRSKLIGAKNINLYQLYIFNQIPLPYKPGNRRELVVRDFERNHKHGWATFLCNHFLQT